MLKDLKKKSKSKSFEGCVLKGGAAVLFDTQEQFNLLCGLLCLGDDSIVIDGAYCCSLDHQGIPEVYPLSDIGEDEDVLEAFGHKNLTPIDFDKWYRKFK